jgi:putative intracellular protease/amidase
LNGNAVAEIVASDFQCGRGSGIDWSCSGGTELEVKESLHSGGSLVRIRPQVEFGERAALILRNNTFDGDVLVRLAAPPPKNVSAEIAVGRVPWLSIDVRQNRVRAKRSLLHVEKSPLNPDETPSGNWSALAQRLISWRDRRNLYTVEGDAFLSGWNEPSRGQKSSLPTNVRQWMSFWGLGDEPYQAIVVVGGGESELLSDTAGGRALRDLLQRFAAHPNRWIGAIGHGAIVPASLDLLYGREVACGDADFSSQLRQWGAVPVDAALRESGRIVTARSGNDSIALADVLSRNGVKRVLLVLSNRDFWFADVYQLRGALERPGTNIQYVVAAPARVQAIPDSESGLPDAPATELVVDRILTDVAPSESREIAADQSVGPESTAVGSDPRLVGPGPAWQTWPSSPVRRQWGR